MADGRHKQEELLDIIWDEQYDSHTTLQEELQLGSPYPKRGRFDSTVSLIDRSLSDSSQEELTEAYNHHLKNTFNGNTSSNTCSAYRNHSQSQWFPIKYRNSCSNLYVALQIEPPVKLEVVTETVKIYSRRSPFYNRSNSVGAAFFNSSSHQVNSFSNKLYLRSNKLCKTPSRVRSAPIAGEEYYDEEDVNHNNNNEEFYYGGTANAGTSSCFSFAGNNNNIVPPSEDDFMVNFMNPNAQFMGVTPGDSLEAFSAAATAAGGQEQDYDDYINWKQSQSQDSVAAPISSVRIEEIQDTDSIYNNISEDELQEIVVLRPTEANVEFPYRSEGPITFCWDPSQLHAFGENLTKSKSASFTERNISSNEHEENDNSEEEEELLEVFGSYSESHISEINLSPISSNTQVECLYWNDNFDTDFCPEGHKQTTEHEKHHAHAQLSSSEQIRPAAYIVNTSSATMQNQIQFVTNQLDITATNVPFVNILVNPRHKRENKNEKVEDVSKESYIVELKGEVDDDEDEECEDDNENPVFMVETKAGTFSIDPERYLKATSTSTAKGKFKTKSMDEGSNKDDPVNDDSNNNLSSIRKSVHKKKITDSIFHESIVSNLIAVANVIKQKTELRSKFSKSKVQDEHAFKIAASSSKFRSFLQSLNQKWTKFTSSMTSLMKLSSSESTRTNENIDEQSLLFNGNESLTNSYDSSFRSTRQRYHKTHVTRHDKIPIQNCRKRTSIIRQIFIRKDSTQLINSSSQRKDPKPRYRKYSRRIVPLDNFKSVGQRKRCADNRVMLVRS